MAIEQEANVFADRERGQQGRVLEHQAHIGGLALVQAQIGLGHAVDAQLAAGGQLQAGQDAQDRRFTGPGRAHHRQALAGLEGEVHLVEHQPLTPGHRETP